MSSHESSSAGAGQGQGPGQGQAPAVNPRQPLLPSSGAVIQAGAFGAALSGVTTGIADTMRVQAGEITPAEAAQDVARASLQGALTMAVASTVGHMVRARPIIGLAILATAGIGALMMMGDKKRMARAVRAVTGPAAPSPAAVARPVQPAAAPAAAVGETTASAPRPAAAKRRKPAAKKAAPTDPAAAAPEDTPAGA